MLTPLPKLLSASRWPTLTVFLSRAWLMDSVMPRMKSERTMSLVSTYGQVMMHVY